MLRLLLTLSIANAACGGNAQMRTEVEALRVDMEAMKVRQDKAWQTQAGVRGPVRSESSLASPTPAQPKAEMGIVAKVEAITKEVCACQDMECADKAMEPLNVLGEGDKPGEEEMEGVTQSLTRLTECMFELAKKKTNP